jgi:TRAP-type C4-dicarboxylate transport system permease small subunit
MLEWITKIDDGLERLERVLVVGLYTLLIGMICVNIFTRNFLHWTSHYFIELSPTVVLWLALVGATLALKHHRHIKIELLLRFLPRYGWRLAVGLTSLFAMGVCGVLIFAAVPFVRNEIVLFGAGGWPTICFPLFFATALLRFSIRLLRSWRAAGGEGP